MKENRTNTASSTPDPAPPPSVAEIAALTARLRHLRSPEATEAQREAFLADKNALLARIPDSHSADGPDAVEKRNAKVLAHLQDAGQRWGGAKPLPDIPADDWHASIAALRDDGHAVNTVGVASGDTADEETGYCLDTELSGRDDTATAVAGLDRQDGRFSQGCNSARIAYLAALGAVQQDTAEQTRAEQLVRWHTDDQAGAGTDDSVDGHGWSE